MWKMIGGLLVFNFGNVKLNVGDLDDDDDEEDDGFEEGDKMELIKFIDDIIFNMVGFKDYVFKLNF